MQAVFEPVVTSLRLDGENAGFSDGKATYVIGNEFVPKPENVAVFGLTVEGETPLDADQYSVDLGGLDFAVANSYTITYTYNKDTSVTATLTVTVVNAAEINLSLSAAHPEAPTTRAVVRRGLQNPKYSTTASRAISTRWDFPGNGEI